MVAVLAVVALGFVFIVSDYWRRGATLVGLGAGFAAALRLFLPDSRVGLLRVRTRNTDVVTYLGLSTIILIASVSIDSLGTN